MLPFADMIHRIMAKSKPSEAVASDWFNLPDEALLQKRIRDLRLRIEHSALKPHIGQLYDELDARGITFHPPCYLADEWLCPDREPIMGIPFYLAHPRLIKLEQKMMFEAEGGTPETCMQLLRHECGHAMNYAYRLFKRTRWREIFGHFNEPYRRTYSYQPYSKRYVVHLPDNYAQSHPDEDFAETFAVWLTPGSDWRSRYEGWPVMAKLHYVEHVMQHIRGTEPVYTSSITPWAAHRMTSTLAAYYERKRRELGTGFPGYYDGVLQTIFSNDAADHESAARFIRRHRKIIMDAVAQWTGHRKYDIYLLIKKLGSRAEALRLYRVDSEAVALAQLTGIAAAVCSRTFKSDVGTVQG